MRHLVSHLVEARPEVVAKFLDLRQVRRLLSVAPRLLKRFEDPQGESPHFWFFSQSRGQLRLVRRPDLQCRHVGLERGGQIRLQFLFDRLAQPPVAPPAKHRHQSREGQRNDPRWLSETACHGGYYPGGGDTGGLVPVSSTLMPGGNPWGRKRRPSHACQLPAQTAPALRGLSPLPQLGAHWPAAAVAIVGSVHQRRNPLPRHLFGGAAAPEPRNYRTVRLEPTGSRRFGSQYLHGRGPRLDRALRRGSFAPHPQSVLELSHRSGARPNPRR